MWAETKTYEVIHLDFSFFKETTKNHNFERDLLKHLDTKFKTTKLKIDPDNDVIYSLSRTLEDVANRSLVLLIDEYDAPLTTVIDDKEEFQERRAVLSNFFSQLSKVTQESLDLFL